MQPKQGRISRRSFFQITWNFVLGLSGVLGVVGLLKFLGFPTEPSPPTEFDLGDLDNYPPGSRTILQEATAVIQNTPEGLRAFSLVCPHLGCTLELTDEGFSCPCHGSKFDKNGAVENGPAKNPMTALRLEESAEGKLVLFTE